MRILKIIVFVAALAVLVFLIRNKLAAFFYNSGNDLLEKEMYKEAVELFSRSVMINGDVAVAHYALAKACSEAGMQDKAVEEYNKTIRLDPKFTRAYLALARLSSRNKEFARSVNMLKSAEKLMPEDPEVKELMGQVLNEYSADKINSGIEALMRNNRPNAVVSFKTALEIKPDNAYAYYVLGYFYYTGKDLVQAEALLKKSLLIDGRLFLSYKLLGDIYFEKMMFEEAVNEYRRALVIRCDDSGLLNNLGLAYMNMEIYSKAIPFLKEALALDPGNINMLYSLSSVYRDNNSLEEAVNGYLKLNEICPDYPNLHNDLGDIYKRQGRNEESLNEYKKEIYYCTQRLSVSPDDAVFLTSLAAAYNGIGEYAKARELIDKALLLNPGYRDGYMTLSGICRNQGNPQEAMAALEKARGLSSQRYLFVEEAIDEIRKAR